MSQIACDFFGFSTADGPTNMARDDALAVYAAAVGRPALRFYDWSEPTLSLGYFQRAAHRIPGLPFVRRPTGGGAIVHDHDLTYALALPIAVAKATERPWPCRVHDAIRAALAGFGVDGLVCAATEFGRGAFLCFEHVTPGDVLIGKGKVVGSAQRKRDRGVLIHGSVLLAASPSAPHLPGLAELTDFKFSVASLVGAFLQCLGNDTGWRIARAAPPLAADTTAYASDDWNLKR